MLKKIFGYYIMHFLVRIFTMPDAANKLGKTFILTEVDIPENEIFARINIAASCLIKAITEHVLLGLFASGFTDIDLEVIKKINCI